MPLAVHWNSKSAVKFEKKAIRKTEICKKQANFNWNKPKNKQPASLQKNLQLHKKSSNSRENSKVSNTATNTQHNTQAAYQRWSDSGFLLSDPILFLKNDICIRSESCFCWNHTILIQTLSESVLWCPTYIFVLCLFCLIRQHSLMRQNTCKS